MCMILKRFNCIFLLGKVNELSWGRFILTVSSSELTMNKQFNFSVS